jgi:superfamily II DNA or RNA helicase
MTINNIIETFNKEQQEMFNRLNSESKHQFRVPTGFGKGYVMIAHILHSIINTEQSSFAIASHRLSLNNQHLRDLINFFIDLNLIGSVKFLTVGSQVLSIDKLFTDDYELAKKFNNQLFDYNFGKDIKSKLSQDNIFTSSMSKKDITKILNKNTKSGFKTIIITTYNSLDKISDVNLDVVYLDEAHILATNKEDADFKKSFEIIKSNKRFFFTATPKDMQDEILKEDGSSEIFLMNNEEIFGKSYEVSFVECVQNGYITEPIIHIAYPKELTDGTNYDSIDNKAKFVKETFEAHEKWLKSSSSQPDTIDTKMLVRCESVPSMWEMYSKLMEIIPSDILICAGASYNDFGGEANHVISGDWEKNRDEFVKKIQKVESDKKMIILNYDIFSEGINVPGITGVMFLQGKMPSIAKVIQNVGRSTRIHPIDRKRLKNSEIVVGSDGWVKPNCAVIIPYWDSTSEFTKRILADIIRKLRSKLDFSPRLILSIGDDFAKSKGKLDLDGLNQKDKNQKKWKLINEINQEIENMDLQEIDHKENNRINSLSKLDLLKEKFG